MTSRLVDAAILREYSTEGRSASELDIKGIRQLPVSARMEFDLGISITQSSILAPWGNAHGGWLGRCDFETRDFPCDAAEFEQVIGEHGGADFSRCQGYE